MAKKENFVATSVVNAINGARNAEAKGINAATRNLDEVAKAKDGAGAGLRKILKVIGYQPGASAKNRMNEAKKLLDNFPIVAPFTTEVKAEGKDEKEGEIKTITKNDPVRFKLYYESAEGVKYYSVVRQTYAAAISLLIKEIGKTGEAPVQKVVDAERLYTITKEGPKIVDAKTAAEIKTAKEAAEAGETSNDTKETEKPTAPETQTETETK